MSKSISYKSLPRQVRRVFERRSAQKPEYFTVSGGGSGRSKYAVRQFHAGQYCARNAALFGPLSDHLFSADILWYGGPVHCGAVQRGVLDHGGVCREPADAHADGGDRGLCHGFHGPDRPQRRSREQERNIGSGQYDIRCLRGPGSGADPAAFGLHRSNHRCAAGSRRGGAGGSGLHADLFRGSHFYHRL